MASIGPGERIWHYDGTTATRHHPRLDWDEEGFTLTDEDQEPSGRGELYRWSDLVPLSNTGGRTVYGLRDRTGWRLGFAGAPPDAFGGRLPAQVRYGGVVDRLGLWWAAGIFTAIAAATVFMVLRAPEWIAPYIPQSWEDNLGDAMVGDFGGRLCETPASKAALAKLQAQLGKDVPIRQIGIANVPMVNAVALPGGRILIFEKLIAEAKSPDELAGVLAHEIGHVRHRDTLTGLVRQLGLSVVLGGLNGNVGGTVNGLLAMSYSREAESAADQYSIRALKAADISPMPTAAFFDKLRGLSGGDAVEESMSWMASHPVSSARKAAFERSAVKGHAYKASLSAPEWQAVVSACKDDKTVRPPSEFF